MKKRLTADDSSLLERVFSLASREAQTLESLSSALDMSIKDLSIYWFIANKLRRCRGHVLPVPFDAVFDDGEYEIQYTSGGWYASTQRLTRLLEEFQINEGLAVHYGRILTDPEGGHYELNLAANEIVLAMQLENPEVDVAQMRRVCVQACAPTNGIELLASNVGKMLLSIERFREEPFTPAFIEQLYAEMTEGIEIKESSCAEGLDRSAASEMRGKTFDAFCMCLWPGRECGSDKNASGADDANAGYSSHTLINALIALHFFKIFRPFPAGNAVFAYLLYFLILHRAGYHFSAHVPVIKLLYARNVDASGGNCLPCEPEELSVECDGYYDWTRYFESAVELLICEQRWVMDRLDGMGRRRERFRHIINADKTLNYRQKEVLLEAVLHSNAEFTYAIHARRYDVSYPCVRSDFARLLDAGFLRQHDDGVRHFFVAAEDFRTVFFDYLKEHCTQAFFQYYDENGFLRDEYRGAGNVFVDYNKDVGFYEQSLLEKTYVEHYDFRRTPIADCDGPHEHVRPNEEEASAPGAGAGEG